jgi:hypothetical protein
MDQLFALGNVSNWNEILEIAPYQISGDHHEQMQTVAEGNFVFAGSEGTFGGKPRRSSISSVSTTARLPSIGTSWPASLPRWRTATESSEPCVITALAQRWSGLFSHSAANAVAQLKS